MDKCALHCKWYRNLIFYNVLLLTSVWPRPVVSKENKLTTVVRIGRPIFLKSFTGSLRNRTKRDLPVSQNAHRTHDRPENNTVGHKTISKFRCFMCSWIFLHLNHSNTTRQVTFKKRYSYELNQLHVSNLVRSKIKRTLRLIMVKNFNWFNDIINHKINNVLSFVLCQTYNVNFIFTTTCKYLTFCFKNKNFLQKTVTDVILIRLCDKS